MGKQLLFLLLAGCATGVRGRGRYARLPTSSHVAAACCAVSHQPLGSMVLAFHLAKVVKREGKNSAQLSLRFTQGAEADGLTASEPLLAAFAFPFGAEAVVPKERIASEVRASHAGGSSPSSVRLFQPPPPPTPWAWLSVLPLSCPCSPVPTVCCVPSCAVCSQEYTFTLTHGDGSRFQGFCRLVLPPAPRLGSKLRYPWVLCMVSKYPWSSFYFTVRH